jgi:RTX calcium-binding nonapeptide repeat (4 copies)
MRPFATAYEAPGQPGARRRSLARGMPVLTLLAALAVAVPSAAMTSHAGWPADQHLVMDKGPAGRHNVLVGVAGRHNYLLGGYGDDTIYGGPSGDVIWGDYHESGWPARQTAVIHAGNGRNLIYANDTLNYVWTGKNPATVVHAHENSGVIHCENPHIVVFTSHRALPHYRLHGCRRISFYSVGY